MASLLSFRISILLLLTSTPDGLTTSQSDTALSSPLIADYWGRSFLFAYFHSVHLFYPLDPWGSVSFRSLSKLLPSGRKSSGLTLQAPGT